MRTRQRFAVSTLMILAGSAIIWFFGWFLWCQFEGWNYIKNTTFQHLLLLLISAWIVGALAKARPSNSNYENAAKSMIKKVQYQPENNPHSYPHSNPDIQTLSAKVDELLAKQTDVHAIMRFFKAREQKDSLKRPIQRSEIKIEIPEEVAEKLVPQKSKSHNAKIKEVDKDA